MTYRINNVNAYNGWDPLKQVVLGNVYLPEFFDGMPDKKLESLLKRVLEETIEDLDNIESTLKEHGVDVIRLPHGLTSKAQIHENDLQLNNIKDYIEQGVTVQGSIPKPALTPRDNFITLGKKIMQTSGSNELDNLIDPAVFEPGVVQEFHKHMEQNTRLIPSNRTYAGPFVPSEELLKEILPDNFVYNPDWFDKEKRSEIWRFGDKDHADYDLNFATAMNYTWLFWGPTVTRVGDTLVYDCVDTTNMDKVIPKFFPEFKKSRVAIGGHNDGTFCLPKPGLVVCASWSSVEEFKQTFPGWDVLCLKMDREKNMTSEWGQWKTQKNITGGKWWHPEASDHPEMVNFVDSWLNKWVGFAEETIFEVNMLSISPECILSLNYQEDVHNKLKEHGIEPIYCRFRHRNFWDGGLHCLTLDTLREGGQQNYGL